MATKQQHREAEKAHRLAGGAWHEAAAAAARQMAMGEDGDQGATVAAVDRAIAATQAAGDATNATGKGEWGRKARRAERMAEDAFATLSPEEAEDNANKVAAAHADAATAHANGWVAATE